MMIPTPTVTRSTGAPAAISQIARLSSSIFPTSDINDITPLSPPIIMIKNNKDAKDNCNDTVRLQQWVSGQSRAETRMEIMV